MQNSLLSNRPRRVLSPDSPIPAVLASLRSSQWGAPSGATRRFAIVAGVSILGGLCLGLLSCSSGEPPTTPPETRPTLSLTQSGPGTVELQVAGPYALRALQARLTYDSAAVRLTRVEPGKESERLDRVFSSDPARAEGSLVLGISDTRQVPLPARGALFRISFEAAAGGTGKSSLRVEDALGARENGAGVKLSSVSAEVGLP